MKNKAKKKTTKKRSEWNNLILFDFSRGVQESRCWSRKLPSSSKSITPTSSICSVCTTRRGWAPPPPPKANAKRDACLSIYYAGTRVSVFTHTADKRTRKLRALLISRWFIWSWSCATEANWSSCCSGKVSSARRRRGTSSAALPTLSSTCTGKVTPPSDCAFCAFSKCWQFFSLNLLLSLF